METQDQLDGFHAVLPPEALAIIFKRFHGESLTEDEQAAWNDYEQRHAEATRRRDMLGLVDLEEVMLGDDTEAEMLVDGLLVRGMHHVVYGAKESGKTWLLLVAAAQLIARGEAVIWVDEEMGRKELANRLRWIGAKPEDVGRHFTYMEFPSLDGSSESQALWNALLEVKEPALIVVDAHTEVLAAANLNENLGTDVAKWNSYYVSPARRLGAATAFIDHTGHDVQGRAVGSRHKGAQSKVELEVSREGKKFTDTRLGVIKVKETKNTLAAPIPGEQFFELGGEAGTDGTYGFVFRMTRKPGTDEKRKAQSERRQRIIEIIRTEGPLSKTQIANRLGGKRAYALAAVDELVADERERIVITPKGNTDVYAWNGDSRA